MPSLEKPHRRLQHQHQHECQHDRENDLGSRIAGAEQHQEKDAALEDRLDIRRHRHVIGIGRHLLRSGRSQGLAFVVDRSGQLAGDFERRH